MKKLLLTLPIIICLSGFMSQTVSANGVSQFDPGGFASMVAIGHFDKVIQSAVPVIKSGSAYTESDDPLLRRGTQNTDSPQNVFFAIPVALTVIFFIVLLMRKK
jgi:hypothetical protein